MRKIINNKGPLFLSRATVQYMGNVLKKVGSKPPPKDLAEYIDGGRLYPYNCLYPSTSTTDPSSLPLLTHDRTLLRQLQLARRLAPFYRGLDQPADVFTLDVEENQRALQRSFQEIYAETGQKRNRAFSVQSGRKTRAFFLQQRTQSCEVVPPSPPPPCTYWSASPDQETPNQPNQMPSTESRTFQWPKTLKKRRGIGKKVPKYSSSSENIRKPLITMAELYRDPVECPICLLYYPKNVNFTKCCHKPICTECFLQIHRSPNSPQVPASCPFCTRSEFGVYYVAPTFEPTDAASNSDGDLDSSGGGGGGGTSTVDGSSNNVKHAKLVKKYSSILDKICPDPEHVVMSDQLFPILAWRNALEEELMNSASPGLEITLGEETTQHLNRRRFIFSRFRRPTLAPPVSSRETPRETDQATTNIPSHADIQNYVQVIQQMGIDLEQAMLTEAIRQSLGRTTGGANGPNDHHMELTLPPPLSVMANESATSSTDSIPLHMLQARLSAVRSRSLPGQI